MFHLGTEVTDGEQTYEVVAIRPRSDGDVYELYDFENREQFDVSENEMRANYQYT